MVPETDDPVAVGFDGGGSRGIPFRRMLPAVAFDGEAQPAAGEVGDVISGGKLPRELHAELAGAQVCPQPLFRIRHVAPQFARAAGQSLFSQCCTPIPNPFPQGKGLSVAKAA